MICVVTDHSVKPWLIEVNGGMCCDWPKFKTLVDCSQWYYVF